MKFRALRSTVLALALPFLLLACKQKHDPVKPTVTQTAVVAAVAVAA